MFICISAGVVFFGLAGVGLAERSARCCWRAWSARSAVGAIGLPFAYRSAHRTAIGMAGVYGMVMYAYWTFYSVPQVVEGLGTDRLARLQRDLRRALRSTAS